MGRRARANGDIFNRVNQYYCTIVELPMDDAPQTIDVLYVDNDPETAQEVARGLQAARDRFAVETVADAESGLERVTEASYDSVVSVYELSGRDGIALLEAVREEYPDLPFVLFAEAGDETVASRAIAAGVTEYLPTDEYADTYEVLATRIESAVAECQDRVARRRAKRRYEAIFDDPERLLSVVDPTGRIRQVNDTAMEYTTASREEVRGVPFWESPWGADVEDATASQLAERVADGEYVDFEVERDPPDRDRYVLAGTVRPVTDSAGAVVALVASARDVTDQKQRQRERKRYERMVNTMLEAACIYDAEGRFALVNEYLADFYGTTPEQLAGRESKLLPKVRADHEGDPYEALLAGEREEVRGEVEGEFPGHGHEILEYRLTPLRIDGKIEGVVGVSHEITALKERERALEKQNERLDQFASFVAHDLRNPLNVATGRLTLARDDCESDHLAALGEALDRMEALIEDLLAFAREGHPVATTDTVALGPLAEDCWRRIPSGQATLAVETDLTIQADEDRLGHLLRNLLDNAVTHAGSDLTVRIGDCDGGFYVADDGPGIPPDDRETVFEAGYSTEESGTGFGLAIVAEIADAHGWDVAVTASEAGGTRFEITDVDVR